MNKTDAARQVVARLLLCVPDGGRIPTVAELADAAGAGFGTVHAALQSLEAGGAIETTAHGSQGRRLTRRDVSALWAASGRGALTGVLPLPQSREFSGLATAFTVLAEEPNLPLQLMFRQGNSVRLRFLHSSRVDFVLMSLVAAQAAPADFSFRALGPHTYYGQDAVVVITAAGREPDPHGRVPIDRNSYDHSALTEAEFPEAQLVDTPYLLIPELVASGGVDAAVWHQTSSSPLLTATGLAMHPLRHPSPADDAGLSCAALVWRTDDPGVGVVLAEAFETGLLEQIQREVMAGARVPHF
jgi:hypothetical protein